jgi:hypothetical protein
VSTVSSGRVSPAVSTGGALTAISVPRSNEAIVLSRSIRGSAYRLRVVCMTPLCRPLVVSSFIIFVFLILVLLTCLSLDIGHLWEQATLSLATYNQVAIVANSQISEARHATLEILDLVGYAAATEPFLGLAGSMTTLEGREFLYSLIALVLASDLPDEITEVARSMLSFGFFEDLPQDESPSEEEEDDDEEGNDGGDQGILIEIDLNSPPRELFPPQPAASSSCTPVLMPAASFRSLRSQASSVAHSSSSNVDSPHSAVSKGSKKHSKSFFLYFLLPSLMLPISRIGQVRIFCGRSRPLCITRRFYSC